MRRSLVAKFKKNKFWKNVAILFSGSAISQSIPILISPILTRLYNENVFGILFLYSSIVLILSSVSSFRYELFIVMKKREIDAIHVFFLCILLTSCYCLILLAAILPFNKEIAIALENDEIEKYLLYVPLSVFFLGIIRSYNYWYNRKAKYKKTSINNMTKSFGAGFFQVLEGVYNFLKNGLVIGNIIGQSIGFVQMLSYDYKFFKKSLSRISLPHLVNLLKIHKGYSSIQTLIIFLNNISSNIPVILITKFYGLTTGGYFGMSVRIVSTPLGLLSQAINQVFFKEGAVIINSQQDILRFLKKTYKQLLVISIIPFTLFAIGAPYVFRVVLGEEWGTAGMYTRILLPWLFIAFLNVPVSSLSSILYKQKKLFIYSATLLTLRVTSIYAGFHYFNDIVFTLLLFSGVGFFMNIYLLFYHINIAKKNVPNKIDI